MENVSSLLWLFAFGGMFYWMMKKGGCGMHGGHSHQHGEHGHAGEADEFRDPVCGMQVDPDDAAGMTKFEGKSFFFCSPSCLAAFEKDPGGYAKPQAEQRPQSPSPHAGHQRHAGCC